MRAVRSSWREILKNIRKDGARCMLGLCRDEEDDDDDKKDDFARVYIRRLKRTHRVEERIYKRAALFLSFVSHKPLLHVYYCEVLYAF